MSNAQLVSRLKQNGVIVSSVVENAMLRTDRALYSSDSSEAYNDNPHPIGWQATISAPHMHAHCLEILRPYLYPGASVLDVGIGAFVCIT